jgi:hypothetical protein
VWVRVPPPALEEIPANPRISLLCTRRSILTEGRIGDSFGDNCRRFGLEEDRIHSPCGLLAHAGQDVGIGPQGRGDVFVTQDLGDDLDRYVVQKCQRGISMPQVVEVDRGDTRAVAQGFKVGSVEGLRVQIAPLVGGENESSLPPTRGTLAFLLPGVCVAP